MEEITQYAEFFTKLLFGVHLAMAFSGITPNQEKRHYVTLLTLVVLLQNSAYFLLGQERTIQLSPLLIHLPIVVYLCQKARIRPLHSILSLMFAFQLLSLRAWFGEISNQLAGGNQATLPLALTLVSFPLAFLLGRYLAPHIANIKEDPQLLLLVGICPLCYYVFSYVFVIYSWVTMTDSQQLMQFTEGWFVLIFVIYSLFSLHLFQEKKQQEVERAVLLRMQTQAEIDLKQLHKQYELEEIHRHDLRHHGNTILSYWEQGQSQEAIAYIQEFLISPDRGKLVYSNNESLNLILHYYQKLADEAGILLETDLQGGSYQGFSLVDLCGLLSNGLENAVHACQGLPPGEGKIFLKIQRQGQTLRIDLRNTFAQAPVFVGDMPHSNQKNHGYGTKSMRNLCEKYQGITRFAVMDGEFCFQTLLKAPESVEQQEEAPLASR